MSVCVEKRIGAQGNISGLSYITMHRLIFVSAFQDCLIVCLCLWGGRIFLIGLFRSVVGLKTIVHAFLYGVTFSNVFFFMALKSGHSCCRQLFNLLPFFPIPSYLKSVV